MAQVQTRAATTRGRGAPRALALAPWLSGCILTAETCRPAPVVDVPPKYRAGVRQAARRIAGAGLVARLPLARADHAGRARASRQSRHRGGGRAHRAGRRADAHRRRAAAARDRFRRLGDCARAPDGARASRRYSAVLNASYEIDFWGKNRATLRAAEFNAIASRFDREVIVLSTVGERHQHLFPGPRRAGPAAHRARQRRRGDPHPERLSGPHRRRHRDRPRHRAAGIAGGAAARRDPAARSAAAAEHRDAGGAARRAAGAPDRARRKPTGIMAQRVSPGLPSDLLLQRPDIREAEAQLAAANANVRKRARRAVPEHLAHRPGRLCQRRAATRCSCRSPAIYSVAAGLTQPVFDGFRLLCDARSAARAAAPSCCSSIARRSSRASPTSSAR